MKKGLLLYGANCTVDIWDSVKRKFCGIDIEYVEYPHDVTRKAKSVSDITQWVYDKYSKYEWDFIIGHSMGGIIALELASRYNNNFKDVIIIESNLRPAEKFYRNLMTSENMERYGEYVMGMIKREAPFYSDELKQSLQGEFDYTQYVDEISADIYGIYGDRGVKGYEHRIEDLFLDENISEKINFIFIENSCHMPMVENPTDLAEELLAIIG